jgi:uncharacterized protein (TIGR02145 family)
MKYKFISIIILGFFLVYSCEKDRKSGFPTDGDGNEYDTVVIGTQVWLTANLKTTKHRNGDQIYLVTDNVKWPTWPTGAYCWYANDAKYKETYGALYNWKAASNGLLCPEGWHVPMGTDWKELNAYLGIAPYAGGKLKETGAIHWMSQSEGTTNETDFTALPGGCRYLDGTFRDLKQVGNWWWSDFDSFVIISYSNAYIGEGSWNGNPGFSVRCVKNK